MEVVIALFIIIAALSFSTPQGAQDVASVDQAQSVLAIEATAPQKNDVSICPLREAQMIERDLTVQVSDEDLSHAQ